MYKLNKKIGGPLYTTDLDELKMNANCPDSEKTGSGPGSCGGASGKDQLNKSMNDDFKKGLKQVEKSKFGTDKPVVGTSVITPKIEKSVTRDAAKLVNDAYNADISVKELTSQMQDQADKAYNDALDSELIKDDTKEVKAAFQKVWISSYKKALSKLEE